MAKESLREHLNRKLKEKGTTLKAEKAKAKKYKSIAAAKKGGSLYYTDKNGKVMAAVYATDLKDKKSNEFSISTYQKTNKDYYCKVPHFYEMPILISNYKVSIFDDEYILLESLDIPLKYLIALEPKPQPDSKEREIIKYYAENQKRYD